MLWTTGLSKLYNTGPFLDKYIYNLTEAITELGQYLHIITDRWQHSIAQSGKLYSIQYRPIQKKLIL